nr:hypothetical protein [Spongiactinospora rosea]
MLGHFAETGTLVQVPVEAARLRPFVNQHQYPARRHEGAKPLEDQPQPFTATDVIQHFSTDDQIEHAAGILVEKIECRESRGPGRLRRRPADGVIRDVHAQAFGLRKRTGQPAGERPFAAAHVKGPPVGAVGYVAQRHLVFADLVRLGFIAPWIGGLMDPLEEEVEQAALRAGGKQRNGSEERPVQAVVDVGHAFQPADIRASNHRRRA